MGLKIKSYAGKYLTNRKHLPNRKQSCKVNRQLSDLESLSTGVPQGSLLGSPRFIFFFFRYQACYRHRWSCASTPPVFLRFIIVVNDLHISLRHSDVNMRAGDTSLSFSSKSISFVNECVNEDLQYLRPWLMLTNFPSM